MRDALASPPLLTADDPPPVECLNGTGRAPVVLLCDHAHNRVPAALDLRVPRAEMDRHIAYDIGALWMTERLAERLDAPAVVAGYSRLVIDPNRPLDDPTSIPEVSDGTIIPANHDLDAARIRQRVDALYIPYHAVVASEIDRSAARGTVPAIISIHSFTPVMHGFRRPWHIGVLWDWDARLSVPLIASLLRRGDICVGDNQPYSGRGMVGHTTNVHADQKGLPNVLIEVRQDLIAARSAAIAWADLLADTLIPLLADDTLYRIRHHRAPEEIAA